MEHYVTLGLLYIISGLLFRYIYLWTKNFGYDTTILQMMNGNTWNYGCSFFSFFTNSKQEKQRENYNESLYKGGGESPSQSPNKTPLRAKPAIQWAIEYIAISRNKRELQIFVAPRQEMDIFNNWAYVPRRHILRTGEKDNCLQSHKFGH